LLLSPRGKELDIVAYSVVHDSYRAPWLDKAMKFATNIGEPRNVAFGLAFFAFFGTPTAQLTAKLSAVSMLSTTGIVALTKWITGRHRPSGAFDRRNSSFPSGHAAGAAAIAVLIQRRHPALGPLAWILALWIGVSRIYLGRHFPSDVLSGILLGVIGSWLILRGEKFFEKLHF
jgi:undecaprenyl-diphosphatase